ncbi:MAG: coproporphyrinogen III oxidase, partial [Guyparkeria sp.]
ARARALQSLLIEKGLVTSEEDALRRHVITELICHFQLSIPDVEARFGIDFPTHFADALAELKTMADDDLLRLEADRIVVEPRGRLLIRNICMAFDEYHGTLDGQRFSRVI